MSYNEIILLVTIFIVFFVVPFISGFIILINTFRKNNDLKSEEIENKKKEIENQKYSLFMQVDLHLAEEAIDELVKTKLEHYVFKKFTINQIDYINEDDTKIMISSITKELVIGLSEVYLFYIKLLTNIQTDEDLIKYINEKVRQHTFNVITDYNRPKL